jgi:acyl dehydratase
MSVLSDVSTYGRAVLPLVPGASRLPFVAGGGGDMPELSREARVEPDAERLAAYARVCGLRLGDRVPVTWPHVQAFALQMSMFVDGRFPVPAIGLVHLRQRFEQHAAIRASDPLDLVVRTGPFEPHARGRTFPVTAEASVDGELCWVGTSTYLRPGSSAGGAPASKDTPSNDDIEPSATWRVPHDLGRRYAAVSGDRNPIHLSDLTAKAFGFPRAIAHGMWTAARALGALEGRLPDACAVDVQFRKPLFLAATVVFGAAQDAGGATRFTVRDAREGTPHLDGVVAPAGRKR